jgi:glycolate oxidase FAD binding subunit
MLRLEGFEASVKYRAGELQKLLARFGDSAVEMDAARTKAGWAWVRDCESFHGRAGNVWRISVKPSDAPELVKRMEPEGALYDWGGGLIWVLMPEDRDLRALMAGTAGHATLIRGGGFPRFHPQPAPLAAISKGLRQKFDPRGILNAGLMG